MSREDEIQAAIAERGSGGSKKGRPTGFTAPKKTELSNKPRAIHQRALAAERDAETVALDAADAADRSAKKTLRKQLKTNTEYTAASEHEQSQLFDIKWEKVSLKRWEDRKSSQLSQRFITELR